MHRNTYLFVSVLAVFTALVIGVNIGRQVVLSPSPTPTPIVTPPQAATISAVKPYRNSFCKVAFDYPDSFTFLESASGSAVFSGPAAGDVLLVTCQKEIPRPAITQENIEDIRIGTVAAKLYHTQSEKDGTLIDSFIFQHPGTKLDVFLAGTGEIFQKLLQTLTIF
ncbi:MAG: hypothetical protein AAB481_01975 [Patescibacteria group bacterium]